MVFNVFCLLGLLTVVLAQMVLILFIFKGLRENALLSLKNEDKRLNIEKARFDWEIARDKELIEGMKEPEETNVFQTEDVDAEDLVAAMTRTEDE